MAVEFLHELDVPFFKVGSGDTNNFPYLEKTAKKGERKTRFTSCCINSLLADALIQSSLCRRV